MSIDMGMQICLHGAVFTATASTRSNVKDDDDDAQDDGDATKVERRH